MTEIAGLKIVDENSNNWICFCPFHTDTKTPNLYITKSGDYAGYYKCFACGKYGHISELDKNFKRIIMPKNKLNIKIDWGRLHSKYFANCINFEIKYPEFIPWKIAQIFGCGWDGECYTFPLRNEYNKIIGIQRRFLDGRKRSITGSRAGLFLPQGVNCLRNQYVYVCEGLSDTVTCMDLGFFAIGRMSATTGTQILCRLLKGKNVVIVGDNGKPGEDAANKLATKLIKHNYNVKVIFPLTGNDLREWVEKDKENAIKALTEVAE